MASASGSAMESACMLLPALTGNNSNVRHKANNIANIKHSQAQQTTIACESACRERRGGGFRKNEEQR